MHTTVPFKYRARLRLYERIPAKDYNTTPPKLTTKTVEHGMGLAGTLHPTSGKYDDALALAEAKLRPLRDGGWLVESLIVTSYGASDA